MKSRISIAALFLGISMLAGCASVPMSDPSADAAAKQFAPVDGKSVLYIYRNETFGAAVKMDVSVDGKAVGQTASETYFRLVLDPGHHTVDSQKGTAKMDLDTEAGKVYYVWQEVKMGVWSANSALHNEDTDKGQKDVKECKLIKTAN
ncbi:MAG: DUF2846 domain-containing protein [Bacillota bacterium]